jgi:hypothetical protein
VIYDALLYCDITNVIVLRNTTEELLVYFDIRGIIALWQKKGYFIGA